VRLKARFEFHLEGGDQAEARILLAQALEEHAASLRDGHHASEQGVVDLTRGKMAYIVEVD
jgi:hypothetical protein